MFKVTEDKTVRTIRIIPTSRTTVQHAPEMHDNTVFLVAEILIEVNPKVNLVVDVDVKGRKLRKDGELHSTAGLVSVYNPEFDAEIIDYVKENLL